MKNFPKIAIVVDSTAYFTPIEKSQYLIEVVPVNVMFEGKIYRDGINLTTDQAYQFLKKNPEDWATSAPSVGDFLTAFRKVSIQGVEAIICLTLAQSISATWNNARNAKEIAKKEMPELKIEIIDSGTAVVGERLLALRIGQMVKEGKEFGELVEMVENFKKKLRVFVLLETIRYVYRSGRIPKIASKIGAILPLKPILSVYGGKIKFKEATVSKEKGEEKIMEILKENFDENFPEIDLTYIDNLEEIKNFKKRISSLIPGVKISISQFSPIVGYATGPGTIGVGFFSK